MILGQFKGNRISQGTKVGGDPRRETLQFITSDCTAMSGIVGIHDY